MQPASRLYRLIVNYAVGADGELVPAAPPLDRARATGERLLYRQLARLAEADAATIAQATSRYGPLGPTSEQPALGDERRLAWRLNEMVGSVVPAIEELHRWIAAGGGIAVAIPGRLSWAARLLIAAATMDEKVMDRFSRANEAFADGVDGRLSPEERSLYRKTFYGQVLAVLARYQATASEIEADTARGDELVHVRVPPGVTADRLRLAARLMASTFSPMAREGGIAATLEPGTLGRFDMLLGQYRNADGVPLGLSDTVEAWRRAAAELVVWEQAVRLLRAADTRRDVAAPLRAALAALRGFAGLGAEDAPIPSPHATDPVTLRNAAAALLTLRLQQVDAWPLPENEVVGAFGRSLWSLWPRVTSRQPARTCQWPGCSRWLPTSAHGNSRYCQDREEHKREAARQRAERNRRRRGEASGPSGGPKPG